MSIFTVLVLNVSFANTVLPVYMSSVAYQGYISSAIANKVVLSISSNEPVVESFHFLQLCFEINNKHIDKFFIDFGSA